MNERIKQLDKQARLWAIDNTNFPISSHIPSGYTEKFAELIVLECMYVGRLAQINNQLVDSEIKDHFGVES